MKPQGTLTAGHAVTVPGQERPTQLVEGPDGMIYTGTVLRDGLERILRGRTGGLVVLGHDRTVETMASGGFSLDVDFSAQRLRELAKMDGAIVVDHGGSGNIVRAGVQLVPDPRIETPESGTRHRTGVRRHTYAGIETGEIGLVVDSYGLLSISVFRSSAAEELGLAVVVSVMQMVLPVFTQVIVDRVLVEQDTGLLKLLIAGMA